MGQSLSYLRTINTTTAKDCNLNIEEPGPLEGARAAVAQCTVRSQKGRQQQGVHNADLQRQFSGSLTSVQQKAPGSFAKTSATCSHPVLNVVCEICSNTNPISQERTLCQRSGK